MLSDGTRTFTWEHGRQLKAISTDEEAWTYTYDANGLRTGRSTGTTQNDHTYTYYYNGSQLSYMLYDNILLQFTYSASGAPLSVTTSLAGRAEEDACYYYVTNIQGDVIAILNHAGYEVVTYSYDAWGNILSVGGTLASTLGAYNPLRYRGYVYDQETGLYYLQSRYYNPEIGRFINADDVSYLGADGTMTSYNLFAYCANNPVMYIDPTGHVLDVFLDAAFLILDIADLLNDPTNWEYWLAFGADLVSLFIPVITGSGMLARMATKADNIDDVHDVAKFATTGSPNAIGKIGEKLAGIDSSVKIPIQINGRVRIPDALTLTKLIEVKNVKYISNTIQLKDFAAYARATGRTLELYVRPTTKVARTVIDAGWNIKYLW